jgi:hypothetical protein
MPRMREHPNVRRPGAPLPALALVLAIVVGSAGASAASSGSRAPRAPAIGRAKVTITVGQFNSDIADEYPNVDVTKVAKAILKSGADVVGVEEGAASMAELARDLGWPYYSARMQIVSRLPLIDPPSSAGLYTFVEVSPGRVVAMENVHLPSSPYGPNMVRNGSTPRHVLHAERKFRLPAIRPQLRAARKLEAQGIPVFLTGDFNSPSFYDWTPQTVGSRRFLRYPLKWPVSEAVVKAGFRDSFREVYPDPLTNPGLTWPVHRDLPGWNPTPRTPQDRIDFIYATPQAHPTSSVIVGEPDGPELSATVKPFPSDHRDIASTFRVTPVVPPTFVTVPQRLLTVGDDVPVTFHADAGAATAVAILPAGGDPATEAIGEQDTQGATDGSLAFSSTAWPPGAYEAALLDAAGAELSRFRFWVEAPGTQPSLSTSKNTYDVGEPIEVSWRDAPGNRADWVGVYKRGADPLVAPYLLYVYTQASIDGSGVLDGDASGTWPLPPGRYSLYLLKDDLYVKIAATTFRIRAH